MKPYLLLILSLLFVFACEQIDDPYPEDQGDSIIIGGGNGGSNGGGNNGGGNNGGDTTNQSVDSLNTVLDSLGFRSGTQFITQDGISFNNSDELREYILNNKWVIKKGADNSNTRFITLEEFTGHECIFCPLGTREIVRLDGIYGEQLIPIAIHAGSFARPRSSGNKFTTDFRVSGGHDDIYQNTFNPGNSYPRGMVNRNPGTSQNNWQTEIDQVKADIPDCELRLETFYSDSMKVIRAQLDVIWLNTLSDDYNLQLFLLEDHIIDWQKDAFANPVEIPDYDHRHVLRKVVNGTFGKALTSSTIGDTLSFQYIFKVDPSWKAEDMEVVGFVFNDDPSSYEVIQANSSYIE